VLLSWQAADGWSGRRPPAHPRSRPAPRPPRLRPTSRRRGLCCQARGLRPRRGSACLTPAACRAGRRARARMPPAARQPRDCMGTAGAVLQARDAGRACADAAKFVAVGTCKAQQSPARAPYAARVRACRAAAGAAAPFARRRPEGRVPSGGARADPVPAAQAAGACPALGAPRARQPERARAPLGEGGLCGERAHPGAAKGRAVQADGMQGRAAVAFGAAGDGFCPSPEVTGTWQRGGVPCWSGGRGPDPRDAARADRPAKSLAVAGACLRGPAVGLRWREAVPQDMLN